MEIVGWILGISVVAVVLLLLGNRVVTQQWLAKPQPPGQMVLTKVGGFYVRDTGQGVFTVVIDSRLGGFSPEWWGIQDQLASSARVITYDRAGYGWSKAPTKPRSTKQIAVELNALLETLDVQTPLILVGHSQGGLNMQHFARLYPNRVAGAVFLDPISIDNWRFQNDLPARVYKGSGVDKSGGIKTLSILAQLGVLPMLKRLLMTSPPFFYYKDIPPAHVEMIWRHHLRPDSYQVVSNEYQMAYSLNNKQELLEQPFPNVPVVVMYHNPAKVIKEIVEYGGLSPEEAGEVETLWESLTRSYLALSPRSQWVNTESSHMIPLEQATLVSNTIRDMVQSLQ